MRALTSREKRTVRFGGAALGLYLVLFAGWQLWAALDRQKAQYAGLLAEAQSLRQKVQLYQSKADHIQKLMDSCRMDPARLTKATVLAEASAALQKAALGGGVQIGPLRESPARPSSKELGSIQLEAAGPAPALLKFVQQTYTLGFPLLIDSFQIGSEPSRPGQVKLTLTVVVLDFDQWSQEKPHA